MAGIHKLPSGSWRAQVNKLGIRDSQAFQTKAAAANWAAAREAEILAGAGRKYPLKTVGDLLDRYIKDVSPTKKSERGEVLRLEAFRRAFPALVAKQVTDVRTPDLVDWRQARLRSVTPGSVRKEANTLRNAFRLAAEEWHWLGETPFKGFKVPSDNPPRDRRILAGEVQAIVRWLGYRTGVVGGMQAQTARAFLLALRSGMRSGEILSLQPHMLDLEKRVATVPHKTQHLTGRPRKIPLTRHAVRLLRTVAHRDPCFDVSADSMSALFRKATRSLGIKGMTFHDSRAEALTRLSKKVDVMTLARISGHKDLRTLLDHYYRESPEDIAGRI